MTTEGPINTEAWYDAEIAPTLFELAKRCEERGLAFVAVVEYERGERGSTVCIPEGSGLEMRMLQLAAHTVPNVDWYVIELRKLCKALGQDMSGSFVLSGR